jgi:hypothetical protein
MHMRFLPIASFSFTNTSFPRVFTGILLALMTTACGPDLPHRASRELADLGWWSRNARVVTNGTDAVAAEWDPYTAGPLETVYSLGPEGVGTRLFEDRGRVLCVVGPEQGVRVIDGTEGTLAVFDGATTLQEVELHEVLGSTPNIFSEHDRIACAGRSVDELWVLSNLEAGPVLGHWNGARWTHETLDLGATIDWSGWSSLDLAITSEHLWIGSESYVVRRPIGADEFEVVIQRESWLDTLSLRPVDESRVSIFYRRDEGAPSIYLVGDTIERMEFSLGSVIDDSAVHLRDAVFDADNRLWVVGIAVGGTWYPAPSGFYVEWQQAILYEVDSGRGREVGHAVMEGWNGQTDYLRVFTLGARHPLVSFGDRLFGPPR